MIYRITFKLKSKNDNSIFKVLDNDYRDSRASSYNKAFNNVVNNLYKEFEGKFFYTKGRYYFKRELLDRLEVDYFIL